MTVTILEQFGSVCLPAALQPHLIHIDRHKRAHGQKHTFPKKNTHRENTYAQSRTHKNLHTHMHKETHKHTEGETRVCATHAHTHTHEDTHTNTYSNIYGHTCKQIFSHRGSRILDFL